MMNDDITVDDIMAELEQLRPSKHPNAVEFTKIQDDIIWQARKKEPTVTWSNLSKLFNKRFGFGCPVVLRERLRELEKERG